MKYHLHISRKNQRRRLEKFAGDRRLQWRMTEEDALYVKYYKAVMESLEAALRLTSHGHAPWIVIEATDRRYRELALGQSWLQALRGRLDAPPVRPKPRNAPASEVPPAPDARSVLSALDLGSCVAPRSYPEKLETLQGKLAMLTRDKAFGKHALILVFEGADAAGKGGTIRRVAHGIDPRLYRIVPVAKPSDEEAAHPYLWRFWRHVPRRGRVAIFDRSWYGRVLVERVEELCDPADWARAYGEINDFEADLAADRTIVVKFWLAISKEEQLRRFKERERRPFKRFKITKEDWRNRERWEDYERAVDDMVARTSTDLAPWTLVEAEDKRFAHLKVLKTVCDRLEAAL